MADEKDIRPTWGYKMGADGKPEGRIFELEGKDKLPNGWEDSPAKLKGGQAE